MTKSSLVDSLYRLFQKSFLVLDRANIQHNPTFNLVQVCHHLLHRPLDNTPNLRSTLPNSCIHHRHILPDKRTCRRSLIPRGLLSMVDTVYHLFLTADQLLLQSLTCHHSIACLIPNNLQTLMLLMEHMAIRRRRQHLTRIRLGTSLLDRYLFPTIRYHLDMLYPHHQANMTLVDSRYDTKRQSIRIGRDSNMPPTDISRRGVIKRPLVVYV